eukprot:4153907-Pleurochrysis_carterae.AAC.1
MQSSLWCAIASVTAFNFDSVALLRWYIAATDSKACVKYRLELPALASIPKTAVPRDELASRLKEGALADLAVEAQRQPMLLQVGRQCQGELVSRKQGLWHADRFTEHRAGVPQARDPSTLC